MTVTQTDEVRRIWRMLNAYPTETFLTADSLDTASETFYFDDAALFKAGQVWEFQMDASDTEAESIFIRSVNEDSTITGKRGHQGSTAVTHAEAEVAYLKPRFPSWRVVEAYDQVMKAELFAMGVFEIVEHQIVSVIDQISYEAPTTECEQFLEVYQRLTSDTKQELDFSKKLMNVDESIWGNGKIAYIWGNWGTDGDIYYVNCAHKLDWDTLDDAAITAIRNRVAAILLREEDAHRVAGDASQADQSVQPITRSRLATQYDAVFQRWAQYAARELRDTFPPRRVFQRSR